ncbi:tetratricopeptide repeat protein [Stakelama marina]|uniref:Tetratricopeptide repeat protein n=1 Tax=Stakelama marina TaxID=2826939 RepID=A0A8T4IE36_9SPHN|nr:tetratricopeptide repeat protein [Stakelama marina]MBR0552114.1 tetratricopeptide repeat protein [Stakelama marina]
MKRMLLATAAMIVAGSSMARASDKVSYAPPPAWVIEHPVQSDVKANDSGPVSILSLDVQVREDHGVESRFTDSMIRINNAQGLQLGNVALAWLPETQQLVVHKILIHRGGSVIDVLQQGQKLTILRREQNLEQATLDGALTATLFPAGLQVGDVLELATTIISKQPVLGDHKEALFGPVNFRANQVKFSISWPDGEKLRLAESKEMPPWQRKDQNGFATASLSLTNVEPIVPPSGAPLRYSIMRTAEASDFASWADVSHLFAPLYAKASQIPASGSLRDAINAIRAASSDPKTRAEAALKLVQGQVRYVALEMGQGGLVPANATDTWSRRYGDCKGKTALLLGILHELGVEAEPVVVNSVLGDILPERLPSVALFDHILVRATIAGKSYWLDGTRQGDNNLDRIEVPNFGWGLPISTGAADLIRILPPPLVKPSDDLTIELDGRNGLFGPVPAHISEILRGDTAYSLQQSTSALTGDAREKALRDYWSNQFDFIKPTKTDFSYDPATGEALVTLDGIATLDLSGGYYETDGTGVGYRADFSRMDGSNKDAPFRVDYPTFSRTQETILLPPDFPKGAIGASANVDETVAGVTYKRKVTLDKDKFVIVRSSRSIAPEFPASDAQAAQKRLRALNDATVYLRVPPGYKPSAADIKTLTSDDQSVDKLLSNGNVLLDAGKYADALKQFTRATDLAPDDQTAWTDRGLAEAWLKKFPEASVSLDRAASKGPATIYIHHGRGLLAELQGDNKTAITEFSAAIASQPDDVFALAHRASARLSISDFHGAIADTDKILSGNAKNGQAYWLKFQAFLGLDDEAQAEDVIKTMLAAIPDDPQAKINAASMYSQLDQKEKARALLSSQSTDVSPAQRAYLESMLHDDSDVEAKERDLDKAIALKPDEPAAYMARAVLRRQQSDFSGALADVNKVLSLNPKDGNAYLLKANILSSMGRPAAVVDVAKQVAEAIPENGYGHVVAAKIYSHFDMRKEALAEIDAALKIEPEPYIYLNRADVMDPTDLDGRIAEAQKALILQPNMESAQSYIAGLLEKKGDYRGAIDWYDKLIAKHPDDLKDYGVGRGIAKWKAGNRAGAQSDFAAAAAQAKESSDFNNICYELASAGVALDAALKYCNIALIKFPDNPAYLDSRALTLLRMHRNRDAIVDYDAVLAKSPNNSSSLMGRAIAEAELGQTERAKADAKRAVALSPTIVQDFQMMDIVLPPTLKN